MATTRRRLNPCVWTNTAPAQLQGFHRVGRGMGRGPGKKPTPRFRDLSSKTRRISRLSTYASRFFGVATSSGPTNFNNLTLSCGPRHMTKIGINITPSPQQYIKHTLLKMECRIGSEPSKTTRSSRTASTSSSRSYSGVSGIPFIRLL